jgi:hypothetical protein
MAGKGSYESVSLSLNKIKPYLAMVSLQFGYAGMYIISMVGLKRGMNHFVLATYRHFIAFAVIAPFALVLERFGSRFSVLSHIDMHAYRLFRKIFSC